MLHKIEIRRFESEKAFEENVKYELQHPRFRYYLLAGEASRWEYIPGIEYSSRLSIQFYPVVSHNQVLVKAEGITLLLNQRIHEDRDEMMDERDLAQKRIHALTRSLSCEVPDLKVQDLNPARILFETPRPERSLGIRPASEASARKWFAQMHELLEK